MGSGSLFQRGWLEDDYHPEVVAYYFKQWNGFQMPFHRHDATEIMYNIAGVCQVEIMNQQLEKECVRLQKSEFIVLDANVPHRLLVDDDTSCRMLNVEFRFTEKQGAFPAIKQLASEDGLAASLLADQSPYVVLRDPDEVYHVLKSLVLELDNHKLGSSAMVHLLFSQLLIRIARLKQETDDNSLQQTEVYVQQCIQFLHQNYDRDIQVKDMASAVNLHPGYLQRIFKKQLGQTLLDYVTELRMEKARMLLQQTDVPIADICDYVGVGSRQYFHALFKKHTGQTPLEYRKSVSAQKWSYLEASEDF